MAITSSQAVEAMLKTWYKDGVENLLFRNSPVLKKIGQTKVDGKEQAFATIYSRGGAVAANFLTAKAKAAENVRNAEYKVTPGQLFSVFSYNAKEVEASKTRRGAYMKIAGNKAFAATEAFRKTLAGALYGRGYGEIAKGAIAASTTFTTSPADIVLPESAIMKIDVGSTIELATSINGSAVMVADVDAIDGNTVTITPAAGYTTVGGEYIRLAGSVDSSGNPMLPVGLDAWLPIVNARVKGSAGSPTAWDTYIQTPFFNVTRSIAPDRLAGQFYAPDNTKLTEKKYVSVQELLKKCRRAGGVPDMIVMNDTDWFECAKDIETTNTLFTQTSEKGKKKATMGFSDFAAAFSTNWVDNIYDDPYCPEGKFYVLDLSAVDNFVYTNLAKVDDGIGGNEPGKPDAMSEENEGQEDKSYKLLIDDFITVDGGADSADGPSVRVTFQYFGSIVVTNPSVCGVGLFAHPNAGGTAQDYSEVLGY